MKISSFIASKYILNFRSFHFISVISIISVIGIIIGVAALICVLSIFNGFREFTQNQLIGYDPHLRISEDKGGWLSPNKNLNKKLEEIPEISYYSSVIQSRIIAIKGSNIRVMELNAYDEKSEFQSGFSKSIVIGKFFTGTRKNLPSIVLGAGIADGLKVLPGDTITLMSFDMVETSIISMSQNNGIRVKVIGIFSTSNPEYDVIYGFVSKSTAKSLLNLNDDESTSIDIRLNSIENTNHIKEKLQSMLHNELQGYSIKSWYDFHKDLYNVMEFERLAVFIILSLIIIIAVFNLLASLVMTVVEKRKDIAVLKAIGANDKVIKNAYIRIGLIIGSISTSLGTIVGLLLCYGQINYSWFKLNGSQYLIAAIPVSVHFTDVLLVFVFTIVISYLSTIYPSRRATKTSIIEFLRSE